MQGGYRKGAGRKKGFAAKTAEEARKLLSERVAQEIGSITEILISRAKRGDMRAIKELFDRAWGRPNLMIEEKFDKPFVIEISETTAKRYGLTPTESSTTY